MNEYFESINNNSNFFLKYLERLVGLPEIELVQEAVQNESLIYIAGYVAKRFRAKYPHHSIYTQELPKINPPRWLEHISKGHLTYPSESLIRTAKILEPIFNEFHGSSLAKTDMIFQKVANLVQFKMMQLKTFDDELIPFDMLLCLVRTRTYIRLYEMNLQREEKNHKIRLAKRSEKAMKFYT